MINYGTEKKIAEYYIEISYSATEEVKEKYNEMFLSCVPNNKNKMKRMKKLVEMKYLTILTYGILAHYLNLLVKDITPKTILVCIVEVNTSANKHLLHGLLKENGGHMLQILDGTQYNFQEECVNAFIKIFHKYVEIANKDENFDLDISKVLSNVGLYWENLNWQKHLKEVSVALDKLQSDSENFSTAVEV